MEMCIRRSRRRAAGHATHALALLVTLGVLAPAVHGASVACSGATPAAGPDIDGVLTLGDAVRAALAASPELVAAACDVRMREADVVQAGVYTNPELRVDVENVAGSGDRRDDEQAETTVLLSQLFELGGKRSKRVREASLARDLATWDYEARRLAVRSATVKAFVATLAAQERVTVAEARQQLAERTARGVAAQVDAGAAPPVDLGRARLDAGRAEIERVRATHALEQARTALAATWGHDRATFARVEGTLRDPDAFVSPEVGAGSIANNPDVARGDTTEAQHATALALARARRIPDVTLGAGGRYFSDKGDGALVVEVSLPLPVFDRAQGRVAAAQHRLVRAGAERRGHERRVRAALAEARQRAAAAREEAAMLRDRLLPAARQAAADAQAAFRRGLIHATDLLAAEMTAFELRDEEIRAFEAVHLAAVDVARLLGAAPGAVEGGVE